MQVEVEGKHNFHRIDHNHFGYRPPLNRNGGETIRVGYSHQSMTNSGTPVERNLFDRCDGEIEIISSKLCENIRRFATRQSRIGLSTVFVNFMRVMLALVGKPGIGSTFARDANGRCATPAPISLTSVNAGVFVCE